MNDHFLIFNTVVNAYLYVDPVAGMLKMTPVSADMTDVIPFVQFIFSLYQASAEQDTRELFEPTEPVKQGIPSDGLDRFGIVNTHIAIFNRQMTVPPYNGVYKYYVWDAPTAYGQDLIVVGTENVPEEDREYVQTFWVFKRYMIDETRIIRIIVYNDLPQIPQQGNGQAISSVPNLETRLAPSLTTDVNSGGVLWQCVCDTNVMDAYALSGNRYIVLDENLKNDSLTNLQFRSLASTFEDVAMGVTTGPYPQPRMIPFESSDPPTTIFWSATTINQFVSLNKLYRSNYFYVGLTYSFYSYTDTPRAQFLSSQLLQTWQPSTFFPIIIGDRLYGDGNTIFTIL